MSEEIRTCHITDNEQGMRLDKAMTVKEVNLSRSRIQALIKAGHVSVNAQVTYDCSRTMHTGEMIAIVIPPPEPSHLQPLSMPLEVVYEDHALLVINKPAGLTVHPGAGHHQDTLVNILLDYCGDTLSGIGGVLRPGIVHRLDKDTSGLMMIAKTDEAHLRLSEDIATRQVKRIYHAIVWGIPHPLEGVIEQPIARSPRDRTKMTVVKAGGKMAVTAYSVKQSLAKGAIALVECRLQTGRTHQIRVHLSAAGHALVGDPVYGNQRQKRWHHLETAQQQAVKQFIRQALHAKFLEFTHPLTGNLIQLEAPLPADMQELIQILS